MLSYRIHGMLTAMERAESNGYYGARYPWESAFTGVEVTNPQACMACRFVGYGSLAIKMFDSLKVY